MEKVIRLIPPHGLQREIEEDGHRFRVISCGRRWGKTYMAIREAFNMLLRGFRDTRKRQRGWVIAPTFPLVREDWLVAEDLLKDAITNKKQTEMRMDFGQIGFLEFKSAERDDEGLRGAGLNVAILDEASRISRKAWEYGVRPALADKQGRAIFISTPKGRNYFYELFLRGQEEDAQIKSWRYPTYTNPYFPKEEWAELEANTPEKILQQEYLADFLENEGTVFANLGSCLRGRLEGPVAGENYTIGVDLAKTEDFTVLTVMRNSTCQLVDVHRFRQVDWDLQKKQIISLFNKYGSAICWVDSTGLGDPIEEDLKRSGVSTKDYRFTNRSKEELIKGLTVAIEQGLIGIPDCEETQFLLNELRAFTYEITKSRNVKYQAPEGLHDDGVISLGLAVRGIGHLLYNKGEVKKERKKWGTADDWDAFYGDIDRIQRENPFLSRNEAFERYRKNSIMNVIARG